MNFGAHISIAGGIENAPGRAHEIGCECFQMFSRSPHGGKETVISEKAVDTFKEECKKYNLKNYYIHTPYYINLASSNNRIYYGSISAIRKELEAASRLDARAVVTHLGSARELGMEEAGKKLVEGLKKIFFEKETKFPIGNLVSRKKELAFNSKLLLEITAGAGEIMGDTFEEMAYFIKETEKEIRKNKLGVCFDTAHAFASGYDLRDSRSIKKVFDKFEKIIGMERLELIHCNDSMVELNSHVDRHDNIGNGKIGLEAFEAILREPRLKDLDFIVETPNGKEKEDLGVLKKIREQ